METVNTPPRRKRGAELSVGRRYAMVVEIARAIPPGKTRLPKGNVGPLAERYGVGPEYHTTREPGVYERASVRSAGRARPGIQRGDREAVGKRQRDGTLETVVKYDAEAFSAAWDYLADIDKED